MVVPDCPTEFIDILSNFTYNSGICLSDGTLLLGTGAEDQSFTVKVTEVLPGIYQINITFSDSSYNMQFSNVIFISNAQNVNDQQNILNFSVLHQDLPTNQDVIAFAQFILNEDTSVIFRMTQQTPPGTVLPLPVRGFGFLV